MMQGQGGIQCRLPAHRWQQRIRAFLFNNAGHNFRGNRFDIGGIGHIWVCHNGGRIGIYQNDTIAFFAQCLTGLCPGIIKLACLSDNNRASTNNHNRGNIIATGHFGYLKSMLEGRRSGKESILVIGIIVHFF